VNTLDTSGFEGACRFIIDVTGKAAPDVVNKYLLQAVIGSGDVEGAMQRTPKADRAKILAVDDSKIRGFVANRLRKAGKLSSTSSSELQALCVAEKARRVAASGYTAFIGWSPAAKAFGGTGARGKGKTKPDEEQFAQSQARFGSGSKATVSRLVAEVVNTAPMAEDIGTAPLQESLDGQKESMEEYGTGKLQQAFTKVAGRYV
jgi:hypothetical protein